MVFREALTDWAKRSRWGVLWAIAALMAGSGATVGVQMWTESAKPHIVKVNSVKIEGGLTTGRWLNVQLTAPAANGCLRLSQHLMYQDPSPNNRWKMRHYLPLGTALNGMSYSSVIADFNVLLDLPAGLPPGDWFYVDRSAYFCSVWPFHHILQSQTDPVLVHVDPEIRP